MEKIEFEDAPSTATPIDADNLNQVQTNVENALDNKTEIIATEEWTEEE